jgi:peptidoglycan/xylan/chitin deacetylase (PgdA/CDA1 family)
MFYTVKTPWFLKRIIYPSLTWEKPTKEKILYLTFDDGPHPTATPFVLEQLKQYNAKATFFCIGKNVAEHKEIYQQVLNEGHKVGNHTFDHLNGWTTDNETYFRNIFEATKYIDSNLFRPPYGRITKLQAKVLQGINERGPALVEKNENKNLPSFTIIMWSIVSGDFDEKISPQKCFQNVLRDVKPGNIIVFHDSSKAWPRMSFALPPMLEHFSKQGYSFFTL